MTDQKPDSEWEKVAEAIQEKWRVAIKEAAEGAARLAKNLDMLLLDLRKVDIHIELDGKEIAKAIKKDENPKD